MSWWISGPLGACIAELPQTVQLYNTWHEKGQNQSGYRTIRDGSGRPKIQDSMAQYFDGKGWGSKHAVEYNLGSIPALWLVDKKGILRTLNARENLESRVKELLAEKY